MRAFITGITGFAGSHLAAHLLAAGDTVCGCNRSGLWPNKVPDDIQCRSTLLKADVGSNQLATELRSSLLGFAPEVIYHLAAISIPSVCGDQSPTPQAWDTNVIGTQRVLEIAASLPSVPRVVFISSAYVYPSASAAATPIDEQSPVAPRGAYGQTKLAAEELCRTWGHEHGVPSVVVRAFSQAGPRQDPRLMLAGWCRQFLRVRAQPIEVSTLDAVVDMLDVRDAVRAYRLVALHGLSGQTYHVGSGIRRTSGEWFAILHRMVDPHRQVVQLSPGPKFDPLANCTRLEQCAGWRPMIEPVQTVTDTLDDCRIDRVG